MKYFILESSVEKTNGETEFLIDDDSTSFGKADRCKGCGEYISLLKWLPPYKVELELWDSCFGDIAYGVGEDILVSERFKLLWKQHGLKGLSGFDRVDIVKVKRHKRIYGKIPRYFRVNVVRSNVVVDQEASEIEWKNKPTCAVCKEGNNILRWKKVILEPDYFPKENIFYVRGLPGTIITDEKFKAFCDANNITNVNLIPAEDYSYDFYPMDK